MATYLAFDYGDKRIGVAVGDDLTASARPLAVIARDWPAVDRLLSEWAPTALVVGLPLDDSGSEQPTTARARRFARALEQRSGLAVYTCDERYSSLEADLRMRGQRPGRRKTSSNDATAASIILEQWLTTQRPGAT